LEDIESFIALDSPAIARKFIGKIFDKLEQLKSYPESGKVVPEYHDPFIRELLLNKYRIIYLFKNNLISILRVVHGSRLLNVNFDE